MEELDNQVYQEVVNLIKTPSIIYEELARRTKQASNTEELERQAVNLKKELSQIVEERNRLLDAYKVGKVNLKELSKRQDELSERCYSTEKQLQAIQALRLERESNIDLKLAFESILQKIQAKAKDLNDHDKKKLIRLLVEKVVIGHDNVQIIHCVSPRAMAQENDQLYTGGSC